jgi:uncharacterized protein YecE (DUF72 family)
VQRQRSNVKVGCCGFALAHEKYFRAFNCVEINSSFYQLPRVETAERWRAAAPPDFQFFMKAWQVITHRADSPTYRRTRIDERDRPHCGHFGFNPTIRWAWDETFAVATALRAGPTKENIAGLRRFFERAKRGKFHMGWEPRGEWDADLIASLCRELDLIHVVDPFKSQPATEGKIRYFRLHGLTGSRHRYSDDELRRLKELCGGRKPVCCLFNNVAMTADARRFAGILSA